jgi:CubicO group peptidase (beta-lactamase class C family)
MLARRACLVVLLCGCAASAGPAAPAGGAGFVAASAPDARLQARVDSAVRTALADRRIPGAAVAILRGDTLLLACGYGVAELERRTPVTPRTIFQIASTTKPFTAMAVLLLVDSGRVDLDAPAARYLPWLPGRYAAVTVRQLLTHTGGVAPDVRRANVDEFPREEFRRRLAQRAASFEPGAAWQYANAGYTLLADIVEEVSGQEFGAFLRARIFDPLGMRATGYRVPETDDRVHAAGYDLVDGRLERAPHVFSGWGNSGIETNVLDLARWAAALHRGALLSPAAHRAMYTPGRVAAGAQGDRAARFPFSGAASGYGLGWFLTSAGGTELVTHGGAIAGFSSVVNRYPATGITIVVLANGKQGADRLGQADAIARVIARLVGIDAPAP